ncbi:MAG: hypothetical protein AAGK09_03420 [Planctomycetota bacterium]
MPTTKRRLKTAVAAACLTLGLGVTLAAANADPASPEPAWSMTIEVAEAAQTPVGQTLIEHLSVRHPQLADARGKLTQMIGLDPIEDIQRLTLWSDTGNPNDVALTALLHQSVGNLEGWMLAMPGYESEELNDQTLLHSFLVEDKQGGAHHTPRDAMGGSFGDEAYKSRPPMRRVWVALPMGPDGNYRVAAAFDAGETRELAAALATGDAALGAALPDGAVAAADMARLPRPLLDAPPDAPASAMMRAITGGAATITADETMRTTVQLDADSPVRARQIGQLMQGAAAMVQLAAMEDPNVVPLADMLASLRVVDTDGRRVTAELTATPEQLIAMMDAHDHGPAQRSRPPAGQLDLDN